MRPPQTKHAVDQVAERLADLLGVPTSTVEVREESPDLGAEADVIADVAGSTFVVEWKHSGATAPVSAAVQQLRRYVSQLDEDAIPLIAVPFMGQVGRERCEEAGVSWLDLSGNARIDAPGIRVRIEGRPNRFRRPGRPASAFAPKSARITRWLLMHPDRPMIQRDIARDTDMDEGFTSRIVAKLEEDGLIVREPDGAIRPHDPDLLLDAWKEDYDFSKHRIFRGHVPARSGDALLQRVTATLQDRSAGYAATGLGAAWLLTRFAAFRIATIYLREPPTPELFEQLSFREEPRGGNLWLVVPNDDGVFHGSADNDGIRCVHPVQAYLDLQFHPERADEAAEHLRAERLNWTANG